MNKILIVDDNTQNLYMLEVLLKTNGFKVEQALNGAEALEKAHKDPPDMVISDILMPVMDGFSLCRAWKTDEGLKKIPFIFYTATYTAPKDEAFALSLGAERFLVKPTAPDDFLAVVQEVFQTQKTREQVVLPESMVKEDEYYKEYSEVLIHKLEDKMMQLERANKRLISLYQVSCNLVTIEKSTNMIYCILRTLVETAGYKQAGYFSYNESLNTLSLLDSAGISEESLAILKEKLIFTLGEKQGWVGLVAQSRQVVNITNTTNESHWIAFDPTIKSALFVPVYYENHLMGVIGLLSVEKDAFAEEDEHNIAALANSLAVSIENRKVGEEIRQLNVQLEQRVAERTALLESANKEMEAFTYSVSHDLRAPLRSINGWSHILQEENYAQLNEQGRESLNFILTETRRMGLLIENLLQLSRISRAEMRRDLVDLTALSQNILIRLQRDQPRPTAEVIIQPGLTAHGDGALLDIVLTNLLDNAWKYTGTRSNVRIELGQTEVNGQRAFFVRDNGVGFDMAYAQKLFGVFQRMHRATEFPGTGIGLAIVQRIVHRHGGEVWAEAQVNQGATFYFTL